MLGSTLQGVWSEYILAGTGDVDKVAIVVNMYTLNWKEL